jgi:hypothetical protein
MTPEFCYSFPLLENSAGVTVKFPVLVNQATVIKPGMILRCMYVLSFDTGGNSDLELAHKGDQEAAYSRQSISNQEGPKMPAQLAHELEGYRRTVWNVPNNFILAMFQFSTEKLHLIYSPTGSDKDMDDTRFFFFDGLLVGLPDGKVTVLAVEKGSKSEKAGIKAGDVIDAVGGNPTKNDLSTYAAAYVATKDKATEDEVTSYPVTIETGGVARTVQVPMPPSLKTNFFDTP